MHISNIILHQPKRSALEALKTNGNIVIKPAEIGGGIIQNKEDYIKEALRLLGDEDTYIRLPQVPLPTFTIDANTLANQAWKEKMFLPLMKHNFWSKNITISHIFITCPRYTRTP